MGISTSTLIVELRRHLGVDKDDDGYDDSGCLSLLNRAFWEVLEKFPFREKDASVTFTLTAGIRKYITPTAFEAIQNVAIADINTQERAVLEQITIFNYEDKLDDPTNSTKRDKPKQYFRFNEHIIFRPVPDQDYTVDLHYWINLADLDVQNDPRIPRTWHEIILYGGVWRGFSQLKDYTNKQRAQDTQYALINSAVPIESKEEEDTHLSGLKAIRPDYDFSS